MTISYSEMVSQMRDVFNSGRTQAYEWRISQVRAIVRLLEEEESRLIDALWKDLRKGKSESMGYEINYSKNEAITVINELHNWMKPEKVSKNLATIADTAHIRSEPLGVALVIGAWNYPLQLTFLPMLGAISAGNCVIVKPSELAANIAELLEEIFPKYFDTECIKIVKGGIPETTALLKERFDKIFYTGSPAVGKIVMEAAAKHLTPVVLELGGKSPVYVDPSSDMTLAARRIIWGKTANLGQTCVAPDYILCKESVQEQLVPAMKATLLEFFGEDPSQSPDLGRMINDRHFQRVKTLMEKTGKIAHGGKTVPDEKFIEPTILTNVTGSDPIMQDEIFGPVLPIVTVEGVEDAIQFIRAREKPLTIGIFSKDTNVSEHIIQQTSSGSVLVNDTLMVGALTTLPFGGVGNSGMGAYHGKHSFDAFSHKRACMLRMQAMESINALRYPPYTEEKLKYFSWLLAVWEKPSWAKGPLMWLMPYALYGLLFAFIFWVLGLDEYIDLD